MISICMPYFNRRELLSRTLASFDRLYDDIEVSICDDGSKEAPLAPGCIVTTLERKDHALNPCVPINTAVNASHGDIIVLTNPENEHRDDVLSPMLEELNRIGPDGYVTASCKNPDGRWLAHSTIEGATPLRGPMPDGAQFHFCAMLHRELWDRAGGFDEDYRPGQAFDDNDWLWRLEAAGAQFSHLDSCIVYHTPTGTKWPAGGWQRNAALLTAKWRHRWLELYAA